MNCKSVSIMTGRTSFPLQPKVNTKLTCVGVLPYNYCLYDFKITTFQFLSNSGYFFKILDPIGIISQYYVIKNSHWFREDVQLIIETFLSEKRLVLVASPLSFCNFYTFVWVLPVFVALLLLIRLIVMTF